MNAPQTREKYATGLKRFFDFIELPDNNNATTTTLWRSAANTLLKRQRMTKNDF
jgi:hypothetical protein